LYCRSRPCQAIVEEEAFPFFYEGGLALMAAFEQEVRFFIASSII
jgi:hypothetical protein